MALHPLDNPRRAAGRPAALAPASGTRPAGAVAPLRLRRAGDRLEPVFRYAGADGRCLVDDPPLGRRARTGGPGRSADRLPGGAARPAGRDSLTLMTYGALRRCRRRWGANVWCAIGAKAAFSTTIQVQDCSAGAACTPEWGVPRRPWMAVRAGASVVILSPPQADEAISTI